MGVANLRRWGSRWPRERVCGRGGIRKNCGNLWKNQRPCTPKRGWDVGPIRDTVNVHVKCLVANISKNLFFREVKRFGTVEDRFALGGGVFALDQFAFAGHGDAAFARVAPLSGGIEFGFLERAATYSETIRERSSPSGRREPSRRTTTLSGLPLRNPYTGFTMQRSL
jgi:hypothetical protein